MIKFIHTADIHFGMENYGRIDLQTGIHTRLLDFVKALNFCIDTAINQSVDFFLFAGDAYKTAHPSPTQQKLLLQSFLRLYKAGIPVVIIIGNHDNPLSFGKANALDVFGDLPLDGFHVLAKPTTISLTTQHGPINIVGIPWPTRNTVSIAHAHVHKSATEITEYISRAVAHIIKDHAQKLDPTIPAVLAGHLTVSSGIFSGSEKRAIYGTDPVLLPSQLAQQPFDYVALGHLHRYQNLNPNGYPAIVYSGSIERVDFGERNEEKGFCLVTIEEKNKTTHEFIKTPTRPFLQIDVMIDPEHDHTQQIIDAIKKHAINNAILKIMYHLPEHRHDYVDIRAIHHACTDAHHVVGIIPIRKPVMRQRRTNTLSSTTDLPTLLNVYFDTKPEYKDKKNDLIQKTLQLLEQAHACNEHEE